MDQEYMRALEIAIDELQTKVAALEKAVTQIPQINMETDPSRPDVVNVEPAALVVE